MAGKRRHSPSQDTPSATPCAPEDLHRLTVLSLKQRFRKEYRPSDSERRRLAKDLQKGVGRLFEALARKSVPVLPVESHSIALKHLVDRTVTQATKDWNELGRQYRLIKVFPAPDQQRRALRAAAAVERELPPVDDFDITGSTRKLLIHLADDLEREFCATSILNDIVKAAAGTCAVANYHEPESNDTNDPSPEGDVRSENSNPDLSNQGSAHAAESGHEAFDELLQNSTVAESAPMPPRMHRRLGKERKGDTSLLGGSRLANFKIADQFLGVGERQRQKLVKSGVLKIEGKGTNRKITTESLLAYLPVNTPH
jgi:hypothetical protein